MQRLGLLAPSVNTVAEPEFWRLLPPTASLHAARMRNSTCGVDDARRMLAHVERASDELGSARVELVVFACTASSFVDGPQGEAALRTRIEQAAGAPALTASGAVIDALRRVDGRRAALYTPYPRELDASEAAFLAAHGIAAVSSHGLGVTDAAAIADVTANDLLTFVAAHPPPADADCIFLSCTNLPTWPVIRPLEAAYGLPVVTSNSAAFTAAAAHLGWNTPPTLGALASTATPPPARV